MNGKIFVVAAALALGGAQAQGSGAGSAGSGNSGTSSGGSATSGAAGQPAAQGAAQGQPSAAPSEVTGRVALVNPADHELAIDSGSATTQVKVAPDAKITIDGKSGSFKDIHQGATVRASLDRSGDGSAKSVDVTSGGKKK